MPIKDGTYPHGSRVIAITNPAGAAVSYIADNLDFNMPAKYIGNTDENDEPNGGVILTDLMTGSATLQLAAETTIIPVIGAAFAEKIDPNDVATKNWLVTSVSKAEEKGGICKVRISFHRKYAA